MATPVGLAIVGKATLSSRLSALCEPGALFRQMQITCCWEKAAPYESTLNEN